MRRAAYAALAAGSILIATAPAPAAKPKANHDPEAAQIVLSDLPRFVRAMTMAAQAPTEAQREAILQHDYLDAGTPGLKDFLELRIQSAKNLAYAIATHPKYYAALEKAVPKVAEMEPAIRKSFHELKSIYPDAVFPDVYLVIGVMNSGGTTSDSGLLIGLEMHAKTPETDMGEMGDWHKAVLGPLEGLPGIIAHELMHYQQGSDGKTLLSHACYEGFADFVGELVSGQNINEHLRAYGDAHEKELWNEFRGDMDKSELSHWLYQGSKAKDRPADLGYYMGYRIAQSYYGRTPDKKKAVHDILTVRDYKSFLRASKYADKFGGE